MLFEPIDDRSAAAVVDSGVGLCDLVGPRIRRDLLGHLALEVDSDGRRGLDDDIDADSSSWLRKTVFGVGGVVFQVRRDLLVEAR